MMGIQLETIYVRIEDVLSVNSGMKHVSTVMEVVKHVLVPFRHNVYHVQLLEPNTQTNQLENV